MVMEMQSGSLLRADQAIVKVVAGLVLGAVRRRRESHCREAWYVSTPGTRGFRSLSVLNLLGLVLGEISCIIEALQYPNQSDVCSSILHANSLYTMQCTNPEGRNRPSATTYNTK